MSNLSVFFNTSVTRELTAIGGVLPAADRSSGWNSYGRYTHFKTIGDFGLIPVRYFFGGEDVHIDRTTNLTEGAEHKVTIEVYRGGPIERDLIATIVCIVFLVPGLILSLCKAISYLSSKVREDHRIAKEHLTPVNRTVGSAAEPIKNAEEFIQKSRESKRIQGKSASTGEPVFHNAQPTDALIVYGNEESGFILGSECSKEVMASLSGNPLVKPDKEDLNRGTGNPNKLILKGTMFATWVLTLQDSKVYYRDWEPSRRLIEGGMRRATHIPAEKLMQARTVDAAKNHVRPRANWYSCRRLHIVYHVDPKASRDIVLPYIRM